MAASATTNWRYRPAGNFNNIGDIDVAIEIVVPRARFRRTDANNLRVANEYFAGRKHTASRPRLTLPRPIRRAPRDCLLLTVRFEDTTEVNQRVGPRTQVLIRLWYGRDFLGEECS